MKKGILGVLTFLFVTVSFSQTLFTYGNKVVSKNEFVAAFNKNRNNSEEDPRTTINDYLNLYINYKLKLQAAYDAGLDKDPALQSELENFAFQLAEKKINEEAQIEKLIAEAFERSRKEIRLSQVFIDVKPGEDTLAAFNSIMAAYGKLKGGEDFGKVVKAYSNDEDTKNNNGDLGNVTVFTLPYRLENIAYSLRPQEISAPFRTDLGYHIFKNSGEEKSKGSRKVAQILLSYPPDATPEDMKEIKTRADSLYTELMKGAMFEGLAAMVSTDLSSSSNGGVLPEFTSGTYSSDFEEVAFSLEKAGDISRPFSTNYGVHILKLIETKPPFSDLKDDGCYFYFFEKVSSDERLIQAKRRLMEKKLSLLKYRPGGIKTKDLLIFTDSSLESSDPVSIKGLSDSTVMFWFGKKEIKVSEWLDHVNSLLAREETITTENIDAQYHDFIMVSAENYYRSNLKNWDTAFAKQVEEFKDANLLFGVMEKNVWSRAGEDSVALRQYYNINKNKYLWSSSADAIMITMSNAAKVNEVQERLKNNVQYWKQISTDYENAIADSGRFELSQLSADNSVPEENSFTAPTKNISEGSFSFNYIIKVYKNGEPRTFEEARGFVITDYQQLLEDRWMENYKAKYPVKVNQTVLLSIK